MKFLLVPLLLFGATAEACPKCRPLVNAGIYDVLFVQNLAFMALPLALLLLVGAALYFAEPLWERVA